MLKNTSIIISNLYCHPEPLLSSFIVILSHERSECVEGSKKHGLAFEMFRQQSLRSLAQHDRIGLLLSS